MANRERPLVLPEDLPLALDRQEARPLAVQLADGLRSAAELGVLRVEYRLACAQRSGAARGGLQLIPWCSAARWRPACRSSGQRWPSTCCATVDSR